MLTYTPLLRAFKQKKRTLKFCEEVVVGLCSFNVWQFDSCSLIISQFNDILKFSFKISSKIHLHYVSDT